jgi:indole-3-acetate monooxygenase
MSAIAAMGAERAEAQTVIDVARELGPIFARRADERTNEDEFVADNYESLRESGLIEAGVPRELGGGGAGVDELAAMLRTLAYHCGSTALALSMHTHQVAVPAWRWKYQKVAAVEPLLRRIAKERILLLSSGGSDWIAGSGKAEKVDGGYRITARKIFSSGAPAGDILMTSAVLETEGEPATVLHFGIPMNSPHVKILDTWRTLGMRGTGSHDVLIEGYVLPETAVAARRKAGEWHPLFQIIATTAFPLIYSVYLGVAESARNIATGLAKRKQPTHRSASSLAPLPA